MSSRTGRARAAAPTSFAPPKVNRGWGVSRAYAAGGRSAPNRAARQNAKSAAAIRIERNGGEVRKFFHVQRPATVDGVAMATATTAGKAAENGAAINDVMMVWKWVPEEDMDEEERRELLEGVDEDGLPLYDDADPEGAWSATEMHPDAAPIGDDNGYNDNDSEESSEESSDEEDDPIYIKMSSNRGRPYQFSWNTKTGPPANPSLALLTAPASTTTAASVAAAAFAYGYITDGTSKVSKKATTSTSSGTSVPSAKKVSSSSATTSPTNSSSAAQFGEKRKATRDPTYDPNRTATGQKRRPIIKDKRFQNLPGESPCHAHTTRNKPCLNSAAPNSKFCNLHFNYEGELVDFEALEAAKREAVAAAGSEGVEAINAAIGAYHPLGYTPTGTPSYPGFYRGGGGKWKSNDITEKCERFANQEGRKPCAALTTRGKRCGFSASVEKGGSIYCPVHRGNFKRDPEKFERQQARARAGEMEEEDAAFAPPASTQAAIGSIGAVGANSSAAGTAVSVGRTAVTAPSPTPHATVGVSSTGLPSYMTSPIIQKTISARASMASPLGQQQQAYHHQQQQQWQTQGYQHTSTTTNTQQHSQQGYDPRYYQQKPQSQSQSQQQQQLYSGHQQTQQQQPQQQQQHLYSGQQTQQQHQQKQQYPWPGL